MNENIVGYDVGEIAVNGAVTVRISIGASLPTQGLIDAQYMDSQAMDGRPGMYLKYFPYRYDEVTGKILTGGMYLFDTLENAKDYARWTTEDLMVGEPKVHFWDRPLFESTNRWIWEVVGAHSFIPVQQHAVSHIQHWTYEASDGDAVVAGLKNAYENLRESAKAQGAASVWLLHNAEEQRVGIQVAFPKMTTGQDETDAAIVSQSLESTLKQPSLQRMLPENLKLQVLFDRASPLLTIWLPKSRAEGGGELAIPLHPFIPDITHDHK